MRYWMLVVLCVGICGNVVADDASLQKAAKSAVEKAEFWDSFRPCTEKMAKGQEVSAKLMRETLDEVEEVGETNLFAARKLAKAHRHLVSTDSENEQMHLRKSAKYYAVVERLTDDPVEARAANLRGLLCRLLWSCEVLEK